MLKRTCMPTISWGVLACFLYASLSAVPCPAFATGRHEARPTPTSALTTAQAEKAEAAAEEAGPSQPEESKGAAEKDKGEEKETEAEEITPGDSAETGEEAAGPEGETEAGEDEKKAGEKSRKERKIKASDLRALSPYNEILKRNIKSRRKKKYRHTETKEEDNFVDKLFTKSPVEKKDRFDIDYAPSDTKILGEGEEKKDAPFYKNWIFWTVVGVTAFAGTVLFVKYGVDHNDSMSFDVKRRDR